MQVSLPSVVRIMYNKTNQPDKVSHPLDTSEISHRKQKSVCISIQYLKIKQTNKQTNRIRYNKTNRTRTRARAKDFSNLIVTKKTHMKDETSVITTVTVGLWTDSKHITRFCYILTSIFCTTSRWADCVESSFAAVALHTTEPRLWAGSQEHRYPLEQCGHNRERRHTSSGSNLLH